MSRLSVGAPPVPNERRRWSRVSPSDAARVEVRMGRPPRARMKRQAARCSADPSASPSGGWSSAAANRPLYPREARTSRATPSSTPSTSRSANSSSAQRATAGASDGRREVSATKATLGYSRASAAASSLPLAAATSTSAASTSSRRKGAENSLGVRARASRPGRSRFHHRRGPLEHGTRVRVRDALHRVAHRRPAACSDAFLPLRRGLTGHRFHEVEVTHLVDQAAAKSEVPIDGVDLAAQGEIVEAGFLLHLTQRGQLGRLIDLEVPFGEPPVLVAVANEQIERASAIHAVHHTPRRPLLLSPRSRHPTPPACRRRASHAPR